MNFLFVAILLALLFISYKINRLSALKQEEADARKKKEEDERIEAFMPHLYMKTASEKERSELKDFFYQTEHSEPSQRPHERLHLLIKSLVDEEKDESKKEQMTMAIKRIDKNVNKLVEEMRNREITKYEFLFVLWRYYSINTRDFPVAKDRLEDEFLNSTYLENFPKKKLNESR
jgi:hypothetical protein